ncbi:MAG: TonB-dependent receptor [Acidobacteria bacterium]|nr:TonB-dependent receptor [Acidobacteriota bacterium]
MKKVLFAVCFFSVCASAQVEQATITGTVSDPTGALIPGVQVTVRNRATGVEATTRTNSEGIYRIPYLRPGSYDVSAEAQGFKRARVTELTLTVGLVATVDLALEVGTLQNEVTVTAMAVQLEQQSASLGAVIGSAQMLELPLLGRNPYALLQLSPGVLPKGGAGSGPIVSGGRSNTSEILLDGAETRNSTTNDITYTPPLEAVQEFKVIINSFSSEFGRSGGGVLTAASRSGTNALHGSFYEFLRNEKLNANSWTSNRQGLTKSPLRRNEYGFAVGGPVLVPKAYNGKDKTFFFFNWEAIPQRSPDNVNSTVPTAAERAGDFTGTLDGSGNVIRVYDPLTTRADPARAGRYIRDQFAGNRIPASRFDPIGLKIMQYYPLPNRASRTENLALNNSRANDTWKMFMRFDHVIGSKHRLFFSHGRQVQNQNSPGINLAFPPEGVNGERGKIGNQPKTAVLSDTVTFRPNLLGEFRASLARNIIRTEPRSAGFDFTQLGLPNYLKEQARQFMFPRIDTGDVTSLGPDRASYFTDAESAIEFQGHLTWIRGRHSLKTGFDRTFQTFNVTRAERPSGLYSFSRTFTQGPDPATSSASAGFGVATLLLGAPSGGQFSLDPSLSASQKYYAGYLQDDWKASRKLTLNLGMRWEYQSPWTDRYNQLAWFDPDATDPLTKAKGVLRFAGRDGNPREQSNPDKNNFAPRIGLAWQFEKNTVLRSGWGLFFSPGSGGIGAGASDLGSGFLTQTAVYLGPPVAAPNTPPAGASLADPFKTGLIQPPSTGVGSSANTAFRDWVTPFAQQWNVNFQRTFSSDTLVEAAWIGSRGQRLWVNRSRSAVSTEYLSLGPALDELVNNPWYGIITTGSLSARTVRRSALLQPYNHYTGVSRFRDAIGDSVYHAFTLRMEKRAARSLTVNVSYTVGKLIDNVQERFSGRTSLLDPNNLSLSRSIADYDRPQYFVVNYIYELPWGHGKRWLQQGPLAAVAGNWQLSGITTFGAGTPAVITGPNDTRLPGVGGYASRLKSGVLPSDQRTLDRWFDTAAYAPAPAYTLPNGSRTEPNVRYPGIKTFDLSLSRTQRIRERISLQFRAEFFSAFNTPQFGDPAGSVTSVNFGKITSAGGNRNIQLGLRMSY